MLQFHFSHAPFHSQFLLPPLSTESKRLLRDLILRDTEETPRGPDADHRSEARDEGVNTPRERTAKSRRNSRRVSGVALSRNPIASSANYTPPSYALLRELPRAREVERSPGIDIPRRIFGFGGRVLEAAGAKL